MFITSVAPGSGWEPERPFDCILMEMLKRCLNFTVISFNDFCLCIINKLLLVTKTGTQSQFVSADSIFI